MSLSDKRKEVLNIPKQTFFNLPVEKQEKILKTAVDEFAQYGFDLASIQRIVELSGISRGSFYQYFEDKIDIYGVILQEISSRKMEFLEPVLARRNELGLFDFLKQIVQGGFQFAREYPHAVRIGEDIISSRTLEKDKLIEQMRIDAYSQMNTSPDMFYLIPIENSRKSGEIDSSYSTDVISYYTHTIINGIRDLYAARNIKDPAGKEAEKIWDELISILKNGLSNKYSKECGGR